MVLVVAADSGRIVSCSPSLASFLGYVSEDVVDKEITLLFTDDILKGNAISLHTSVRHKNGDKIPVNVTKVFSNAEVVALELIPAVQKICELLIRGSSIVSSKGAKGLLGYEDEELIGEEITRVISRDIRIEDWDPLNDEGTFIWVRERNGDELLAKFSMTTASCGSVDFCNIRLWLPINGDS